MLRSLGLFADVGAGDYFLPRRFTRGERRLWGCTRDAIPAWHKAVGMNGNNVTCGYLSMVLRAIVAFQLSTPRKARSRSAQMHYHVPCSGSQSLLCRTVPYHDVPKLRMDKLLVPWNDSIRRTRTRLRELRRIPLTPYVSTSSSHFKHALCCSEFPRFKNGYLARSEEYDRVLI